MNWRIFAALAAASTILFLAGLAYAVNDVLYPQGGMIGTGPAVQKPEETSPADKNSLQIVALGDSLTKGTGDATGKGYVGNVRDLLQKTGKKEVHTLGNYGVNGYRADQLLHDLQSDTGVAKMVRQADIVLLTIGGNDLFAIGQDVLSTNNDQIDADKVKQRMPGPLTNVQHILDRLAELNPQAAIVYIGLYNPFYDLDNDRQLSRQVQAWNDAVMTAAAKHPHILFVPTFDLFQIHFSTYIYTDHFHPNQQGYERIAERIVQALQ